MKKNWKEIESRRDWWDVVAKETQKYRKSYVHEELGLIGTENWFSIYSMELLKDLFFKILPNIEKDMKILDVGSGLGARCFQYASMGASATGIDISREMVRIAEENRKARKIKNIKFFKMSVCDMKFSGNYFDVVSSTTVLQHLTEDDRRKAIKEIARVTKPNGKVIIVESSWPYEEYFDNEGLRLIKWHGIGISPFIKIGSKMLSIYRNLFDRNLTRLTMGSFYSAECDGYFPKAMFIPSKILIALSKPIDTHLSGQSSLGRLASGRIYLFEKAS